MIYSIQSPGTEVVLSRAVLHVGTTLRGWGQPRVSFWQTLAKEIDLGWVVGWLLITLRHKVVVFFSSHLPDSSINTEDSWRFHFSLLLHLLKYWGISLGCFSMKLSCPTKIMCVEKSSRSEAKGSLLIHWIRWSQGLKPGRFIWLEMVGNILPWNLTAGTSKSTTSKAPFLASNLSFRRRR